MLEHIFLIRLAGCFNSIFKYNGSRVRSLQYMQKEGRTTNGNGYQRNSVIQEELHAQEQVISSYHRSNSTTHSLKYRHSSEATKQESTSHNSSSPPTR
jgi:hypothetical protein